MLAMNDASTRRPSVLLIDLDNCPHEVLELERTAANYDLIVASHGHHEPRVPLGMASILGQLIAQGRIEIWAMPAGKNSADFGLTFLAGRLSAEQPPGTDFQIASKDKDLDHAVSLLRRSGFAARRIDSSSTIAATFNADSEEVSATAAALAKSLSGPGAKSRPKKKKSLTSTARARGETPELGIAALAELINHGAIAYGNNGVPDYDGDLLKLLAAKAARKRKSKTELLPVKQLAKKSKMVRVEDDSQLKLFD